jgi:hypothetical protein
MIRRALNGGRYGVITIRPTGGQPPAGPSATRGLAALSATRGLAALWTYLVFLVIIN